MARIKDGIFLGASGKIGENYVLVRRANVTFVREAVESNTMRCSAGQKRQSSKFSTMMQFLKGMSLYLSMGYSEREAGRTAYNMALAYNLRNAMVFDDGQWSVTYDRVRVSRGSLTPAEGASVSFADNEALFTWTDNSGVGSAKADDVALPMVYSIDEGYALYVPKLGAVRKDGKASLPVGAAWKGRKVALYLGFASADGRLSADSVFLGSIII